MRDLGRISTGALAVLLAVSPSLRAQDGEVKIVPPHAEVHGKTLGEWGDAWWKWAIGIPMDPDLDPPGPNPLVDPTGRFCHEGQAGPVFFMPGNFGGTTERTCTIPADKYILIPLINSIWGPPECTSCEDCRAVVKRSTDNVNLLRCEIDGKLIENLGAHREVSPPECFEVYLPPNNVFGVPVPPQGLIVGPVAADGYWLMLEPLGAGSHTIHWLGSNSDPPFLTENIYDLTVVDCAGDMDPPVINSPPDARVRCDSPEGVAVDFKVTAADAMDPNPRVTCDPPPGTTFPLGVHEVACTAVDACGNISTDTFTITVESASVLCPADKDDVECTSPAGAAVDFILATCDPAVTAVAEPPSGSVFPPGTTTVQVTARDGSGSDLSCSFEVTVRDTTPPTIACPEDRTIRCAGPGGAAVDFSVTAVDICDPEPLVICDPPPKTIFPPGVHEVRCAAEDFSGNIAECSFTITVVADETPPAIICPPDVPETAAPGETSVVVFYPLPEVEDDCSTGAAVTLECAPLPGFNFPLGRTPVTCKATDAAGNVSECTFDVVIEEEPLPRLDMAILAIKGPKAVTLKPGKETQTKRVKVKIQNRGGDTATISDLEALEGLLRLQAESLGECPDPEAEVSSRMARKFPRSLKPGKKFTVIFEVTFDCSNDPGKSTKKDPGREDYRYTALIGGPGLGSPQGSCPRPPDPEIPGDKGCAPALTDVVRK